jgi:hypothetical protein
MKYLAALGAARPAGRHPAGRSLPAARAIRGGAYLVALEQLGL